MVAGALSKAGHEVRQFDFLASDGNFLNREIKEFNPEIIGISIRNIDNTNLLNEKFYIYTIKSIVEEIRGITNAVVVLGGAGFSLMPDLILEETSADYGIIGEGEVLMVDFANNLAEGFCQEERLIEPRNELAGDEIPSAKYDKRLMDYYLGKNNIAPVQTKRGCTHKCYYCSYPIIEGVKIRHRDPRLVVDDIQLLCEEYNAENIFFVDSVFNDDEMAYLEVVEEMRRRKIVVPWMAFFAPTGLNVENIELMKQTGFSAVELGSDCACDTTLKGLGKKFTFQDIVKTNNLLVEHKISPSHFIMFGGPGETKETVLEGIENIKSLKDCISFVFMGIRILPDTKLASIAVDEGVISPDDKLFQPTYYISPAIDRRWLNKTLTEAFSGATNCIFPPDRMDEQARILYELGCSGPLWDKLLSKNTPRRRRHGRKHSG
jgi:radical SAM superfamily enzyme YgiQ (UPF0313 family)